MLQELLESKLRYSLVLIAMYNVLDLIGRYTPLIKWLKIESRKWLMMAILSRLLFIPAFYFTAKYRDKGWMIMLVSLLGLSNGHLTVCVMTVAPRGYKGPEQNALGNQLVMFLLGSIFSGVALDWLWLMVIEASDTDGEEHSNKASFPSWYWIKKIISLTMHIPLVL